MAVLIDKKYGHPTIVLCDKCEGSGTQRVKDLFEQFKRPHGREVCEKCDGSGRLIVKVETITEIAPFRLREIPKEELENGRIDVYRPII